MNRSRVIKLLFISIFFVTTQSFGLTLTSSDFQANGSIPSQYTCEGKNLSPALSWQNAPNKTQSYAIILDDPDAPNGTWNHWIIFNIPATTQSLTRAQSTFPAGTLLGKNSWQHTHYDGPCPPSGTHHYYFQLYALDKALNLATGATKADVLQAMKNHVLATSSLMGTYSK